MGDSYNCCVCLGMTEREPVGESEKHVGEFQGILVEHQNQEAILGNDFFFNLTPKAQET